MAQHHTKLDTHIQLDTQSAQLDHWQEALTLAFGPFEVEPTTVEPIQGHLRVKHAGGFQFNDLHYKSQKLVRTRESLKHFDNEYYTFGFPLSGPLQVQQMGKQHRVGLGCVYLMKQTSAYVATPLNQLVDLICMFMLGSHQTADLEPIHLTRAKNHIQQQLSHPGLTAAQIARAVGISVSYLHKLFADQGETLQTYLFTQRIAQGRAMLEDRIHPVNTP